MKIAVLSGKGGAGKTLVAVNLAAAAGQGTYIDCDVEEPNGRLFWKPEDVTAAQITTELPEFDPQKCSGCRECVSFCRFHALVYIKEKPMVFPEVCHSCAGCRLVCPEEAISMAAHPVGTVETGRHGGIKVVTGVLNAGEASGIAVIQGALAQGEGNPVVIDCPPGSACSVMESVQDADYCVLVAEPTAFGFHNFCMVHELVSLLGKPCGVIVNKMEQAYEPLEAYCADRKLPILGRIPYSRDLAAMASRGQILAEESPGAAEMFRQILSEIGGDAT